MKFFTLTLIASLCLGSMSLAQQSTYTLKPITDSSLAILPMISDIQNVWLQKETYDNNGNIISVRNLTLSAVALVDKNMQGTQTILVLKKFDEKQTKVEDVKLYRLENQECPIFSIIDIDKVRAGDGSIGNEILPTKALIRFVCNKSDKDVHGEAELTTLEDSSGNLTDDIFVKQIFWKN